MERERENNFPMEVKEQVRREQAQRCAICHRPDHLQIHHRVPASQQGSAERLNAIGLCEEDHVVFDRLALKEKRYIAPEDFAGHWFLTPPLEKPEVVVRVVKSVPKK